MHGAEARHYIRLTAWMPDRWGLCEFADLDSEDADEHWIDDNCDGCKYNFDTYDEESSSNLDGIVDDDGNQAVLVRYESCCPYGRGGGFDCVSFPCPAGLDGPDSSYYSIHDGPMPPMAYSVDLNPFTGRAHYSYAWMQACFPSDLLNPRLTRIYQSINTFDDHKVCWGEENSTPESLPAVVATYCDARANADLLQPESFSQYRTMVRKDPPITAPAGIAIGPGYDAALLVSAQHHRTAYLLLRASGVPANDGHIVAGLRHHDANSVKGFATDPDTDGNFWFFTLDPTGYVDGSQALLLGQLSTSTTTACTSTAPSSSALAAPAAS